MNTDSAQPLARRTLWPIVLACAVIAAPIAGGVMLWFPRGPQRPNILLITLDTTRADRIGTYGYARARTPVIDRLAKEGVLFERAYCPIPLTLPSHASLMTGLYPPEHGLRTNGAGSLPRSRVTLSEHLKSAGYETGAFLASFVLDNKFGLDQGFDVYDDDLSSAAPNQDAIHRYREGRFVVDSALQWLDKPRSRPYFCWVHLYDPHAPYDAHADEFDHAFDDSPYDGEIAHTDGLVGRLVDYVGQHPQTIVLLAGDHGEGLGDHDELQHGYTLYDNVLRVPLIVRGVPESRPGTRIPAAVSLVDVFPTLLELAKSPVPGGISGRSLTAAIQGQPLADRACYGMTDDPFLQNGWSPLRSLTMDGFRYIRTAKPELYDLTHDPSESRNLADTEPERRNEFERRLADLESSLTVSEASAVHLSSEESKALAGLGYLVGKATGEAAFDAHALPDVKDMLPFNVRTQAAIDLLDQGKLGEAEVLLSAIVDESPKEHYTSRIHLGSVWEQLGRFDDAERLYRSVLALRPEDTNALFHLGSLYAEHHRVHEAIPLFERAMDIEPESAQPLYNLALAVARLGDLDRAVGLLEQAVQLDADFPGAWVALGNILARLGRSPEAVAAYQSELAINPQSVESHVNMGVQLAALERLDEAREHLQEAVRIAPLSAEAHFNLGIFLGKIGEHPPAVEALRKSLELKSDAPGVRTAMANLLRKMDRLDEAAAAYEEELQDSPNSLEALVNLGALWAQQKEFDRAIPYLERAVQQSPDSAEARFNLAVCYENRGDVELAQRELEALLRKHPDHAPAAAQLRNIRETNSGNR